MDRDRLKEVKQTDITESRVNEEFVDWLKTKGPQWLLVILVCICAYLGIIKWRQWQDNKVLTAWADYREAQVSGLPGSLEAIAEDHAGVDSIDLLARLRAAQRLIVAVQTRTPIGAATDPADPADPADAPVWQEGDREAYLNRADDLFARIIEETEGRTTPGQSLFAINALNGRAVVAESLGRAEEARTWYTQAAERAAEHYPALADQARARAANLPDPGAATEFPSQQTVAGAAVGGPTVSRVEIDPIIADILLPPDDE